MPENSTFGLSTFWGSLRSEIKFDEHSKTVPVPDEVIHHFKSIRKNLERLRKDLDLDIILVDNEFNVTYDKTNRQKYTDLICDYIEKNTDKNKVVFLDPDTGLQPKRISDTTVAKREARSIWDTLKGGDYLVFYQHRFYDRKWIKKRKKDLADICGLSNNKDIKMWFAERSAKNNFAKLANDVVFYFIKKDSLGNNSADMNT